MREYLAKAYKSFGDPYGIAVYGFFGPEIEPESRLVLEGLSVQRSSVPFHLEYPNEKPIFETYVFDFVLNDFPEDWVTLVSVVFDELMLNGCEFCWFSLDPFFDFEDLFNDYFAERIYAYCERNSQPVCVESVDELMGEEWKSKIASLRAKWSLSS